MEIKKEKLSWIENIIEKNTQIDVDVDIIVPDTKPDIRKILQIDADTDTANCEIQNERVLLSGNVYFNVIYLPDNSELLQSIRLEVPFTDVVAVSGINTKMECDLSTDILSVNYKIINGRKFSVKSVVETVLSVKKSMEFESIMEIDDNDVQVKKSEFTMMLRSGRCTKNIPVNEKIVIPDSESSIAEMLNVSAKVNESSVKLINNKAIVKGDLKITCTYVEAVNSEINTVNHIVPFTEILDIEGVSAEDYSNIIIDAGVCEYVCAEDVGGEIRTVEVKCCLKSDLYAFRDVKCNVVEDCYSTVKKLEVATSRIKLPHKLSVINFNDTLKSNLIIADSDPSIERVYNVFSRAYIENISSVENRMTVNGVVDNYVLYITKDNESPIFCVKNEVEFSQAFECQGDVAPKGEIDAEVLNTSYTISSDGSVDLRTNLKLKGIMYSCEEYDVITDVVKTDLDLPCETTSIIVYFTQDNDTLWDIAKKYSSTVNDIIEINELADDVPLKDMRLLIPKHKKIL